ncbi:MAG: hypothetical protein LBV19_04880 [Streptococcaceae bacterium]|nr:hypothetical protein [Streptococcaceae bacterium]
MQEKKLIEEKVTRRLLMLGVLLLIVSTVSLLKLTYHLIHKYSFGIWFFSAYYLLVAFFFLVGILAYRGVFKRKDLENSFKRELMPNKPLENSRINKLWKINYIILVFNGVNLLYLSNKTRSILLLLSLILIILAIFILICAYLSEKTSMKIKPLQ